MKLLFADPDTIWNKIREPLLGICKEELPEHVYASCKNGSAFLFVSDDGFVILQERFGFCNEKKLFVWKAAKFDGASNVIENYMGDILEIAKGIGASKVEFWTDRKGFSKLLGPEWNMTYQIYQRAV